MPKYDRDLIAWMLGSLASFPERLTGFKVESVAEQSRLLREAENLEADARTVVREVPDGMVLVPREPTPEMVRAGAIVTDHVTRAIQVYSAMLSAASGEKGVG